MATERQNNNENFIHSPHYSAILQLNTATRHLLFPYNFHSKNRIIIEAFTQFLLQVLLLSLHTTFHQLNNHLNIIHTLYFKHYLIQYLSLTVKILSFMCTSCQEIQDVSEFSCYIQVVVSGPQANVNIMTKLSESLQLLIYSRYCFVFCSYKFVNPM